MLCEITFKGLSLILVPTLTLLMIAALAFILMHGHTKDKLFVLCRQIIAANSLLTNSSDQPAKTVLKRIYRRLKIATSVCSDLVDDELYELSRVCGKITESYDIVSAVLLAKKLGDWGKFRGIVAENVRDAIDTLKDFDLIPKDIDSPQSASLKKLFLGRYRVNKAKAYLAQIESKQDKTE